MAAMRLAGTAVCLRAAATAAGVEADRLIFATKKANPEHVARYALADLFLDNAPYGAHTTAADALWMGVPVLTVPGLSFAARVCASLVEAAGIGELVCADREDYVRRAVEIGNHPELASALREKLLANRATSLLFDTPRLVRDLEEIYRDMWELYEGGFRYRPNLANLDVYHEIGVELAVAGASLRPLDDYLKAYKDRLDAYSAFYPLGPDGRLPPLCR